MCACVCMYVCERERQRKKINLGSFHRQRFKARKFKFTNNPRWVKTDSCLIFLFFSLFFSFADTSKGFFLIGMMATLHFYFSFTTKKIIFSPKVFEVPLRDALHGSLQDLHFLYGACNVLLPLSSIKAQLEWLLCIFTLALLQRNADRVLFPPRFWCTP